MDQRNVKCADRVESHWESRKADLEVFMRNMDGNEDTGPFHEYGLSFDYVAPRTFRGQARGYWRYQFSWGGPSDELRLYGEGSDYKFSMDRAEYWFLDWYDGASVDVTHEKCVRWLFNDLAETGSLEHQRAEAMKDWVPDEENAWD